MRRSKDLIQKRLAPHRVKKLPVFYENVTFILGFTTACHFCLPCALESRPFSLSTHFCTNHFNIILHLHQHFQSDLFPSSFRTNLCSSFSPLPPPPGGRPLARQMTHPSHLHNLNTVINVKFFLHCYSSHVSFLISWQIEG